MCWAALWLPLFLPLPRLIPCAGPSLYRLESLHIWLSISHVWLALLLLLLLLALEKRWWEYKEKIFWRCLKNFLDGPLESFKLPLSCA